jgi:glycolate oxidase iron-sulfur subunit
MNGQEYRQELLQCVKCGACKSHCPVYYAQRDEGASARGRIALMKALEKGLLTPGSALTENFYKCTLCGACESSCSPGVNISGLLYYARKKYGENYIRTRIMRDIAKFLMPHTETVLTLARRTRSLSPSILLKKSSLSYAPDLACQPFTQGKDRIIKSSRKSKGRVAIFAGCSVNYLYPQQGEALVNILKSSGYDVVIAKEQVCCGSPLRSLGLEEEARQYAHKNCELFDSLHVDAVLTLCPGCNQTITKGYLSLMNSTIEKVVDAGCFIYDQKIVTHNISFNRSKKMIYHDPCHLIHGLHIKNEPRSILMALNNGYLLESDDTNTCCGFGGIFRYNFPDLSLEIGQRRFENLIQTGADSIVTSCPGCVMQFEDIIKRNDRDTEVKHVVEILWDGMKRNLT